MDQPLPPTSGTLGWRREGYEVALIGPEAMRHKDLLLRAGYAVRGAAQGENAQMVFADDRTVDVIVLDFALDGRPPEAVLLFSRRTSASALLIALVPGQDSDGFRRAFMAGARDVLPTPSRGEDLLASVDYLLEPRALQSTVDRLRQQLGGDETMALPPSRPDENDRAAVIALEAQVKELRREIERLREKHKDDVTRLREQALSAVNERDRAVVAREQAKQKARAFRREAKEGQGQLRLLERACEELQIKLKDARDQRRAVESRLHEAQRRTRVLEEAMHRHVHAAELEVQAASAAPSDMPDVPKSDVDPEAALEARAEDEERLAQLEEAMKERDALERRVRELELELERVAESSSRFPSWSEAGGERTRADMETPSEVEAALSARAEDERRLAELDDVLVERERLDDEVRRLRKALQEPSDDPRLADVTGELRDVREAHRESVAMLDAVRADRENLHRRQQDLEREAADAVMRVEELTPLVGEVERLRAELRAERDARKDALKNIGRVTTQFSALDRETATLLEELYSKQRALVLAYARHEVLAVELANLRSQVSSETRARAELSDQLKEAEAELDKLRSTLGTLSAERVLSLEGA